MIKHSLTTNKGLSLSQAQSISNLCNQRAIEIANKYNGANNYSKKITIGSEEHVLVKENKLPENIVELLKEKAELHACQSFLMENIKAKDDLLKRAKKEGADVSGVKYPEKPKYQEVEYTPEVDEDFGWAQLTVDEYNEYLEANAYASHIGQFIHNDGVLSNLRKGFPNIPCIDWMEIETGKKTPVKINVHHTSDGLLKIHEELAGMHRDYEKRVNYFKSKVKNLTTEENARIAKLNADSQTNVTAINENLRATYESEHQKAVEAVKKIRADFEKARQEKIKEIAYMRIEVPTRFKKIVDTFMGQLKEDQN